MSVCLELIGFIGTILCFAWTQLAQTRRQQTEEAERAKFLQSPDDPKALQKWEKERERLSNERAAFLGTFEKDERRHEMDQFYKQVEVIRKNVQLVDEGRETAARLSSQTMVSVKDEEVAELSGRLELISNRTNKTASDTRLELQRLESQNNALCSKFGADSACNRIRSLQYRVLVKKFTDALSAFRETESGIQAKNRELLVRRFQIVQPELPEPVIAAAVDAEPGDMATLPQLNVFAMAAGGANVEELERKLEHLHAQRRSMMRLEKSILVLNGLILDMHRLVLAQGDSLHSIAVYAERTVEYQKATHVDQAVEYQKNIRKLRCAIL